MKLAIVRALCVSLALFFPFSGEAQDREYLNITTPGKGQPVRDESIQDTWAIDCKVDELLDLRYCFIHSVMENAKYVAARSSFTVRVNSDGSSYVWAGDGESNPQARQILKIDENEIISFPSDQPLAGKSSGILDQLQAGTVLRGRWYEWPSQKQHDETVSLVGFGKALEVARAIVEKKTIPVDPDLANITAWEWGQMAGWLLRSMRPQFGDSCPQLEEARSEIEKARAGLASPYREEFNSGYTVAVSQKGGIGMTKKECDDVFQSLRLRLKNFTLLPQPEPPKADVGSGSTTQY